MKFPKLAFFTLLLLLHGCTSDMCFLKLSEFFDILSQKQHLKGPFSSPCKFFMWTVRCCFCVNDFEHVTQKNFLSWGNISPEKRNRTNHTILIRSMFKFTFLSLQEEIGLKHKPGTDIMLLKPPHINNYLFPITDNPTCWLYKIHRCEMH